MIKDQEPDSVNGMSCFIELLCETEGGKITNISVVSVEVAPSH